MSVKVIRVWDGCRVLGLAEVSQNGSFSTVTDVGGASNSTPVDIDIDPFRGYVVNLNVPHGGVIDITEVTP